VVKMNAGEPRPETSGLRRAIKQPGRFSSVYIRRRFHQPGTLTFSYLNRATASMENYTYKPVNFTCSEDWDAEILQAEHIYTPPLTGEWDDELRSSDPQPTFQLFGVEEEEPRVPRSQRTPNKSMQNVCAGCNNYRDFVAVDRCGRYCRYCRGELATTDSYFGWLRHLGRCPSLPLAPAVFWRDMCACW